MIEIRIADGIDLIHHFEIEDTGGYTHDDRRIYKVKDWIECESHTVAIAEPDYGQSVALAVLKEMKV
ncbi:hypothetical protein RINGS_53 [Arthrobacter phage Rings]|uniref:Uncharacterized protein n=1 Tax=Arthrobacter phage Rings TaxID=1772313 RepID=A0A0U4K0W7_9CAUD|nr:hypothetical protein RINGS_53 [Arthrobacter phage Rings]